MCTLIVLHRCVAGRPLVVAANRDEFLDRPAEGMALRSSRTGPILAPLDLEAGGTWVGLSQRGVFAGLTNLRPVDDGFSGLRPFEEEVPDPAFLAQARGNALRLTAANGASEPTSQGVADQKQRKSRGGVVMEALEAESAADAVRTLSQLEEGAYNPFQLLVADGRDAWLIVYRESPRAIRLEPGPHVVGNVEDERITAVLGTAGITKHRERQVRDGRKMGSEMDSEEPRAHKLIRIRERVEKMVMEPELDLFEGLARVCREHSDQSDEGKYQGKAAEWIRSPFEATCVHIADRYGTRSSLLLELSDKPDASRMWTTDGPPCEQSFENRSSLLLDLGVRLDSLGESETMRGEYVEKNW